MAVEDRDRACRGALEAPEPLRGGREGALALALRLDPALQAALVRTGGTAGGQGGGGHEDQQQEGREEAEGGGHAGAPGERAKPPR